MLNVYTDASVSSIQRELGPSLKCTPSLRQAKQWIEDCVASHETCSLQAHTLQKRKTLPTRLIHVIAEPSLHARLVNPVELDPDRVQYCTLSHVWGNKTFFTCTKENVEELKSNVPLNQLPAAFQNAAFFTMELGFSYLWIDSLCILQNDMEDWDREAQIMGSIYRNSACNLCAAFCHDTDGFLPSRRPNNPIPPSLCSGLRPFRPYPVPRSDCTIAHDDPWEDLEPSPLYQRGWVLQEQMLVSWESWQAITVEAGLPYIRSELTCE